MTERSPGGDVQRTEWPTTATTFSIDGVTYETSGMETFYTGDLEMPVIYMDRGCRVFIRTCRHHEENMRQLSTVQIKEMLQRFGFEPLRRALRERSSGRD